MTSSRGPNGILIHGLDCVEKQVHNDLLQLNPVSLNSRHIIREPGLQRDLMLLNFSVEEAESRMNDLIDLKPGSLGRGTLCEIANLDDDFIGSIGILSDACDIFSRLVEIGRLRFKPIQACVAVDCHCSERLIDLMCNRCGHFSKGRHTHNVRELRARLIGRFFFSLDLRRKVGRRSDRHHTDRRIRNSGLRWS